MKKIIGLLFIMGLSVTSCVTVPEQSRIVRNTAARDFGCFSGNISVRTNAGTGYGSFRAEGCGYWANYVVYCDDYGSTYCYAKSHRIHKYYNAEKTKKYLPVEPEKGITRTY
ncbi:MAG: hypothetical protein JXR95_08205 [Deltaproteobacteria bacterium]|nr:hypothetical protein [Deltaproteobacteria bacterium]